MDSLEGPGHRSGGQDPGKGTRRPLGSFGGQKVEDPQLQQA